VNYETIKSFVEKGFGVCNADRKHDMVQDDMQPSDLPKDLQNLFSLLDDMTNKGLCHFVEILTGGLTKFDKTRWKMKQIIKECLPKKLRSQNGKHHMDTMKQLSQLLRDPHNFRRNHAILPAPSSQSSHVAAIKVLNGLEDLPFRTLSAMHRKLRCIKGDVPQIQPRKKSGWARTLLIDKVRKRCMKMLSELGEGDQLQEPLAKAMAVAGITFKQILECPSVTEFRDFSPEVEALQNDIGKAIWLLEKLRFTELKKLQLLLDPNSELSGRSLRMAVRNLLTEYLFECSEMDTIPECLAQTLTFINRSSQSSSGISCLKDGIQEELECVLSASAQIRQIVLDLVPELEFDQDFADAYMEKLEESDDGGSWNEDKKPVELLQSSNFHSSDSNDHGESIEETSPTNFRSPVSLTKRDGSSSVLSPNRELNSKLESVNMNGTDSVDCYASSSSCWETKIDNSQYIDKNHSQLGTSGKFGSIDSHSLAFVANRSGSFPKRQEPKIDTVDLSQFISPVFSCGDVVHNKKNFSRNEYLAIQEASDETSMVAFRLIGHMLDQFAKVDRLKLDGGDVSYLRSNDSNRRNIQGT
ncbi:unnamed protein product, partial [Ilex paraguariensis]